MLKNFISQDIVIWAIIFESLFLSVIWIMRLVAPEDVIFVTQSKSSLFKYATVSTFGSIIIAKGLMLSDPIIDFAGLLLVVFYIKFAERKHDNESGL